MAVGTEELAGHAALHFTKHGSSGEGDPYGLGEVPLADENQLGEVPLTRGALGTFGTSALNEVLSPFRSIPGIAQKAVSHLFPQLHAESPQATEMMTGGKAFQRASEQAHPVAATLGGFAGAIPSFMLAGKAIKPIAELPAVAKFAQSGRLGRGIVGAGELGAQAGLTEAIQGRPSSIASGAAKGAALGGFFGAVRPAATLSGRTVEEAKSVLEAKRQGLIEQADVEARKYRRPTETVSGGQLEVPARDALAREAEFAWEPARTLAKSVPEPISYTELETAARRRFGTPEDEMRLQNAMSLFKRAYKTGRGGKATVFATQKTADELVDISSQLGGKIPKAIRAGKAPARVSTLDEIDARSIIADVLHEKAPEHLKNAFQEAKERWQDYAIGFRDPMAKYLHVGASAAQETKPAIDLFTRVASGAETPTERRFLQKLEQEIGVKIFEPLQSAGKGLEAAEKQVAKAQAAQQFARYMARAGLISPLLYLLIRRPLYQAARSR